MVMYLYFGQEKLIDSTIHFVIIVLNAKFLLYYTSCTLLFFDFSSHFFLCTSHVALDFKFFVDFTCFTFTLTITTVVVFALKLGPVLCVRSCPYDLLHLFSRHFDDLFL